MLVFFGDTNSDLWWEKVESTEINMINMPYIINGELKDADLGKNKNYIELFKAIRNNEEYSTCGLNKQNYLDYFEPHLKNGDDIIYVTFSHKMSNTFEYMKQAIAELKEKYPERSIDFVDTKNICVSEAMILWQAYKEFKKGKSAKEIIEFVESFRNEIFIAFAVDDLHHLKKGGRISAATTFFGTLLGIKPILTFDEEGKIISYDKVHGKRKVVDYLFELLKTKGENVADYPIAIVDADCPEEAKLLLDKVREYVGQDAEIWMQPVGPTIGVHCGPGTMGIAFHCKKK